MKLLKDYNYTIMYHPGKANVVAVLKMPLIKELHELERGGIQFEIAKTGSLLTLVQA